MSLVLTVRPKTLKASHNLLTLTLTLSCSYLSFHSLTARVVGTDPVWESIRFGGLPAGFALRPPNRPGLGNNDGDVPSPLATNA